MLYSFNAENITLREAAFNQQCNYEQHLIDHRSDKPKLLYSYIRHKKVSRLCVGLLRIGGRLSDNPVEMSDEFVRAFSSVFVNQNLVNPSLH